MLFQALYVCYHYTSHDPLPHHVTFNISSLLRYGVNLHNRHRLPVVTLLEESSDWSVYKLTQTVYTVIFITSYPQPHQNFKKIPSRDKQHFVDDYIITDWLLLYSLNILTVINNCTIIHGKNFTVLRYHWKSSTTSWSYYVSINDFHVCMLENFHRVENHKGV